MQKRGKRPAQNTDYSYYYYWYVGFAKYCTYAVQNLHTMNIIFIQYVIKLGLKTQKTVKNVIIIRF